MSFQDKASAIREGLVLKQLKGCNSIIEYIDMFENDKFVCIVTQLMDMTLQDYIEKYGPLSDEQAKLVYVRVAQAIHHCHNNAIIHGDVKTDNVLIKLGKNNDIEDVRLSDFNLSSPLQMYPSNQCRGTPVFMPPEMLCYNNEYNEKVDLWSLGCLLFNLLTGSIPFDAKNMNELKQKIKEGLDI